MVLEVKGGIWPLWINEFKHCILECEGAELCEKKEHNQEHNENLESRCCMFSGDKNGGEIANIGKEVWGSRWADYVQLETSGTRGGIVIMWDKRIWEGEVRFSFMLFLRELDFKWHLTGVYAPNDRAEREETW